MMYQVRHLGHCTQWRMRSLMTSELAVPLKKGCRRVGTSYTRASHDRCIGKSALDICGRVSVRSDISGRGSGGRRKPRSTPGSVVRKRLVWAGGAAIIGQQPWNWTCRFARGRGFRATRVSTENSLSACSAAVFTAAPFVPRPRRKRKTFATSPVLPRPPKPDFVPACVAARNVRPERPPGWELPTPCPGLCG